METEKMRKTGNATLIFALFVAIIVLTSLSSCGVRKINKSTVETSESVNEKQASVDTTKIKKAKLVDENVTRETKTETTGNEVTKTKTVKPVDPTKPSSFTDEKGNKIDVTNAIYEEKETSISKTENKTDNVQVAIS